MDKLIVVEGTMDIVPLAIGITPTKQKDGQVIEMLHGP
jgi:hypothetical protein